MVRFVIDWMSFSVCGDASRMARIAPVPALDSREVLSRFV